MNERRRLRPAVDQEAMIAAIQTQAQTLELPDWPVFGLVDSDQPGWLCGGGMDRVQGLRAVRLDCREPTGTQRLVAQTQPDGRGAPDLAAVAAQVLHDDDDGEPLHLHDSASTVTSPYTVIETTVVVDGSEVGATELNYNRQATVWSVCVAGVVVIVATAHLELEHVELVRVTDLTPFKRERASVVERLLRQRPL